MTFKMEIYYASGPAWYDISDYVVSCGEIPYFSRNRDYSIDSTGFQMSVSEGYNNTYLAGASSVRFTVDSTIMFYGFARKITKNYDNQTYDFEVENMLGKLKDYHVDTETLNAEIIGATADLYYRGDDGLGTGSSTGTNDNYGYKNLGMLWLISSMFSVAGISLDNSLYGQSGATNRIVENKYIYSATTSHDPATQVDFYLQDIRLDLYMLYSAAQSYANNSTKITSDDIDEYSYAKNKLSFFELMQWLCKIFSIDIYYNGTQFATGFYSTEDDETYSTADDDTYSKVSEYIVLEEDDFNWRLRAAPRVDYQDTTADTLQYIYATGDKSGLQLNWPSNIAFLIQAKYSGASDGDVYPYATTPFSGSNYNMFTPADGIVTDRIIQDKTVNYTKLTIVSDIETVFKHCMSNHINVGNQTSKIVEVSY